MAVKDAALIKRSLKGLELITDDRPLGISEGTAACIAQANSGIKHLRNAKHYEVRLRFFQQKVVDKEVEFKYCPRDRQIADVVTKPLDESKFLWFRRTLVLLMDYCMSMCLVPLAQGSAQWWCFRARDTQNKI